MVRRIVNVNLQQLHPKASIPKQGTEFASGYDVTACGVKIDDGVCVIHLGIAVQPPYGYDLFLLPRSSIASTGWVMCNSPGLIDPDYTGELIMKFRCVDDSKKDTPPYKVGERVGQLKITESINMNIRKVSSLSSSVRGSGGFGSTGK